jgi:8-hydroxy-5-deazaflavin:NADPH oxidoreductase
MKMNEFRIAVLGAGNIGGTLGRKWVVAGHKVAFGVTNPDSARAQKLRAELGIGVTIDLVAAALADIDVVVMALPGNAMDETIIKHAAQLDGKIIIDTANKLGGGPMNSFATFQTYTPHARVFRAFNTLGWENFADPVFDGIQADLLYCGPDGDAREVTEQMISDVGLRPMRLGDVDQVGLVDSVGSLWFALALGQGKGRHLAFKVLSR